MKRKIPLFAALAAAVVVVAGCASNPAQPADKITQGGAMPPSPKEKLDEERLAKAIQGLKFQGDQVIVSTRQRNAAAGENLRLKAERITEQQNTWFISVGAFRDALLADPSNAKSYEGLARALLMEGKTEFAVPALMTAVRLDGKFAQARYELGLVRQMNSDYAGAVQEWRGLAAIQPNYRDVFARMAIASYYERDYGSAWKYLGEADKRKQDVPPQFRSLLKEVDPQQ